MMPYSPDGRAGHGWDWTNPATQPGWGGRNRAAWDWNFGGAIPTNNEGLMQQLLGMGALQQNGEHNGNPAYGWNRDYVPLGQQTGGSWRPTSFGELRYWGPPNAVVPQGNPGGGGGMITPQSPNMGPQQGGGQNQNPLWWLDQISNNLPDWMQNAGQQGAPAAPTFNQWGGSNYTAPDAWVAPESALPETGFDVSTAMDAVEPLLNERMGQSMGATAAFAGNNGVLNSDYYINGLAQAERGRDADLANTAYQYSLQAAQSDADRAARAREGALDRYLSAWGMQGDWSHQGQLAGMDRDYDAWARENDFGMDVWQGQNNQWQGGWNQNMDVWQAIMQLLSQYGP